MSSIHGTGNGEEAENRCRWDCCPIRDVIIDINFHFLFIKIEWMIRMKVEVDQTSVFDESQKLFK